MRIAFMGTDNIALSSFRRLLEHDDVVGLVTQPDRPVGRRQVLLPPAIKVLAEECGIPTLQPESLKNDDVVKAIAEWRPDLIVVMAYGQILPDAIINMAPLGCINVHASLLPRHRGASCIASAVHSGDSETGITIIDVVKKLDAGDILKSSGFQLMGKETAELLNHALGELAPNVLMDAISDIAKGTVKRVPQDESKSTYAPKLTRKNGMIDWSLDAVEIERMIRAYDPWPGTYTIFSDRKGRKRKLKIFPFAEYKPKNTDIPGEIMSVSDRGILVSCGNGGLLIRTVQPEGGRKMPICDFLSGHSLAPGMVFERDLSV